MKTPAKTKRIAEFASKSVDEKRDEIHMPEGDRDLRRNADEVRAQLALACKTGHLISLRTDQFIARFRAAYEARDGSFFRALADSLERKRNPKWSELEAYVYDTCSQHEMEIEGKRFFKSLPSATEILKGWRIRNGLLPEAPAELLYLWEYVFPGTEPPKGEGAMKTKLQEHFAPNEKNWDEICDLQLIQVIRAAENVGFPKLPARTKKDHLMPSGDFLNLREKIEY